MISLILDFIGDILYYCVFSDEKVKCIRGKGLTGVRFEGRQSRLIKTMTVKTYENILGATPFIEISSFERLSVLEKAPAQGH